MLNDYACIILDIFCTSVHFFNTYIKFTSNNKIFIHKDRVLIHLLKIFKIRVFLRESLLCGDFPASLTRYALLNPQFYLLLVFLIYPPNQHQIAISQIIRYPRPYQTHLFIYLSTSKDNDCAIQVIIGSLKNKERHLRRGI